MESTSSAVTMCATVLRVCPCELCVCDHENCQQVLVHTDNACCFRVGQQVCIEFSGAMTRSCPPQFTGRTRWNSPGREICGCWY